MATIDALNVKALAYQHMLPDGVVRDIARSVFWQLYAAHQDDSYKGRVLGIKYSVKLAKLRPLFEHWFGPAPVLLGPPDADTPDPS